LTGLDVRRDCFLGIRNVGRGASTPLARSPKLLSVFLHRLGGTIDCRSSLLRRVA
jgi:hypothetical protein